MEIIFLTIIGIYLFFLPGFFLSFFFFAWEKIDLIERIILSFALSLVSVTLIVSYTNLAGIPLSAVTIMIQVTIFIFIEAIVFFTQYKKSIR